MLNYYLIKIIIHGTNLSDLGMAILEVELKYLLMNLLLTTNNLCICSTVNTSVNKT